MDHSSVLNVRHMGVIHGLRLMPVIASFCSVFSIRLGSIIVGTLCLFQAALLEVACVLGLQNLGRISDEVSEFMNEKDLLFLTGFLNSFKKNPEPYLIGFLVALALYTFSCILLIYGAFKLSACFVAPFVVLELLRQIANTVVLVGILLVLKKNSLDLGPIMGGSIGGGFLMLLQLYLWSCPLSLLQELQRLRRHSYHREPDPLETKLWQQRYAYPVYIE